uniref:dATP/dGTP diphosphohydrolase N-terminal domain-containing protein n=1 Tax=feces metagenome TaxID=1861841 RepID=A0A7M2QN88_9ZZZZ
MAHKFKVGDTVVRVKRSFRNMEVGALGKVVAAHRDHICLDGRFVEEHSPIYIRFDPTYFELVTDLPKAPVKPNAFNVGKIDPNGIDQHAPGAKLDHGKPRHGLVLGSFSNALTEVAKVGTFGANKYTDNGWLSVPNGVGRYTDALLRHHFAEAGGERDDPESQLSHAAHRAWNALAVLELMLRNKEGN